MKNIFSNKTCSLPIDFCGGENEAKSDTNIINTFKSSTDANPDSFKQPKHSEPELQNFFTVVICAVL